MTNLQMRRAFSSVRSRLCQPPQGEYERVSNEIGLAGQAKASGGVLSHESKDLARCIKGRKGHGSYTR